MKKHDNPNYESFANSTYSKPFSPRQILPKFVIEHAKKIRRKPSNIKILDFGAGRDIFGTKMIREAGFDCTAWEIGANFNKELHDYHALKRKYDIVFASNVLNVQPTIEDTIAIMVDVRNNLLVEQERGGYFFCNFPMKPRHNGMTDMQLEMHLKSVFNRWDKYGNLVEKVAPMVWKCQNVGLRI